MLLTPSVLQNLQTSFSKIFETAYSGTPQFWPQVATTVTSTTAINTYGWMTRIPQMREWVGPRVVQNLQSKSYQLSNRDFELTVGVLRNDIEDDQLGIYDAIVADIGRQVGFLYNDLVLEAISNGAVTTGPAGAAFDGLSFFNTAHDLGGGTISNDASGATGAFTPAGWDALRETMRQYKGEDGRFLGVDPNVILIPAVGGYERAARMMFQAPIAANGSSNVNLASAPTVIVVPELPNGKWYAFDTRRAIKPFVVQQRRAPALQALTSPDDPNVFWQRQYVWGVDARGAAGYGPFFLAARATDGGTVDGRETLLTETAA